MDIWINAQKPRYQCIMSGFYLTNKECAKLNKQPGYLNVRNENNVENKSLI